MSELCLLKRLFNWSPVCPMYILVCVLYILVRRQHMCLLVFLLNCACWYLIGNNSKWAHIFVNHCLRLPLFFCCTIFFGYASASDKAGIKTFWTSVSCTGWFFKRCPKFCKFLSNNRIWQREFFENTLNLAVSCEY